MTKLLDEAIEKLRSLSEEEQDAAAGAMLVFAERHRRFRPTPEQVEGIKRGIAEADRGEFVSDEEMAAFWRKCGI